MDIIIYWLWNYLKIFTHLFEARGLLKFPGIMRGHTQSVNKDLLATVPTDTHPLRHPSYTEV